MALSKVLVTDRPQKRLTGVNLFSGASSLGLLPRIPFLDLAIDDDLRQANCFAELMHGYIEGLVEPNLMRELKLQAMEQSYAQLVSAQFLDTSNADYPMFLVVPIGAAPSTAAS